MITLNLPELEPRARDHLEKDKAASIIGRLPLYGAAEVGNPVVLAATLTAVRSFVEQSAPGLVKWVAGKPFRGVETVSVGAGEEAGDMRGVAIQYATTHGVFLASLDRATLEQQIGAVLDGRMPTSAEKSTDRPLAQTAVQFGLTGKDSYLARALLLLLEPSGRRSTLAARLALDALKVGLAGLPADPKERRRMALAYLGIDPRSPQGGDFSVDEHGFLSHSLYGSALEPALPEVPIADAPVTRVLAALERAAFSLAFEGQGDSRGLHATFEWVWRKSAP